MKKSLLLIALTCLGLTGFSQSTLPNGNFEDWFFAPHPTHAGGGFYEPGGGFFWTLNILDTIATPPGLTAYPTDSAHSGTKAARVITRKIDVMDVLIPGVIGTLEINWASMNATLGKPFTWTTKPTRFQGYYMSMPVSNDSSAAILLLSKWNSGTHRRDTIAYNRLVFKGTVNTYTQFDSEVNYWDASTMPDSVTVLLLSCAGYNAAFMMASVGRVGSQAYFDDVTLTNISGLPYLLTPEVEVKISPNPASSFLNVSVSEPVKNGIFEIYTLDGKRISHQPVAGTSQRINVQNLPAGTYFYKLTNGEKTLNTGEVIVSR